MFKNQEPNEENIAKTPTKKRGRKSKKEIEEAEKLLNKKSDNLESNIVESNIVESNIVESNIVESNIVESNIVESNIVEANIVEANISENIVVTIEENGSVKDIHNMNFINKIVHSDNDDNIDNSDEPDSPKKSCEQLSCSKPLAKKRGRKPKGGKIIQQIIPLNNVKESKPNVILHLKCFLKDLKSTNLFGSNLEGYSFSQPNNLYFDNIYNENNNIDIINSSSKLSEYECSGNIDTIDFDVETTKNTDKDNDIRDIWKKLKILEHNLHINNIENKKSACFWDTCEFDNPPVYIPKHFINDTYQVYGCFCSPECAVAHLMEENIDSSIKFERYQLMNHIYSKVYNYNKNIKPAPNPYYMLEKYYGNLSIQEFRSLLRNERLFLVVDKPLTRVMPELHEDNDDFIINNKIIPTNNIKLRKFQKKQTKTNILSERFGLAQN